MKKSWISILFFALIGVQLWAAEFLKVEQKYKNHVFERPVALVQQGDFLYLVEQRGRIQRLFKNENKTPELFIDISDREMEQVRGKFEEGLLGLAFHPNYKTNKKLYISYSQQYPKRLVISELIGTYQDGMQKLLKSERVLLEIPQPFWNHNSGNLSFGKDGYLFIGVGDGGYKDDYHKLAQNLFVLNGKILRIDINQKDRGLEYSIPKDNPFQEIELGNKYMGNGIRQEIYAYGIRNPWGMFYDQKQDLFWFADVGQNLHEEVNILIPGANYGWSYREGFDKFELRQDLPNPETKFVEPLHTYTRNDGVSITGGYVYRGKAIPSLTNKYLFGDWSSGKLFSLSYDKGSKKVGKVEQVFERTISAGKKPLQPTCIAPGYQGEPMLLSWHGEIYQLVP